MTTAVDEAIAKSVPALPNLKLWGLLADRSVGPATIAALIERAYDGWQNAQGGLSIGSEYDYVIGLMSDLARHPALPVEWILRLAGDDAISISSCARRNPSFPVEELRRRAFATDSESAVTYWGNPALGSEALRALALDGANRALRDDLSWAAPHMLAGNPATPEDVLLLLASLDNPSVKHAVAAHPGVTRKIAKRVLAGTRGRNRGYILEALDLNPAIGVTGKRIEPFPLAGCWEEHFETPEITSAW